MSERPSSFMRPLFEGVIQDDLLVPFPDIAPGQREALAHLESRVRDVGRSALQSKAIDQDGGISAEVRASLASAGALGVTLPKEHGGAGLGLPASVAYYETVGGLDLTVAAALVAHNGLAGRAIARGGTPAQRAEWLPRMARGDAMGAFALAEPLTGSDAAALGTRVLERDGVLVLDGTKHYVTNGRYADVFVVFARREDERPGELSAYIIPNGEGTARGPARGFVGLRGAGLGAISFESVPLGPEAALGPRGEGFRLAMETQDAARVELAAACVGAARGALSQAVERVSSRRAFGRPIKDFGMVQSRIAHMSCALYTASCATKLTAGWMEAPGAADQPDCGIEAAICKVLAAEMYQQVAISALDLAGGMGTLTDYPFERHLRDARAMMVYGGSHDVLRSFIALAGLERTDERVHAQPSSLRERVKGLGVVRELRAQRARRGFARERFGSVHPALAREGVIFEELVARFGSETERIARKHGDALGRRQFVQQRLADVAIDLFGVAAVLAATSQAVLQRGPERNRHQLDLATACVELARVRVGPALDHMDRDADELLKQIAASVCEEAALRSS
ncbi:MAG: acyl-CoA dehydrogenase family protein [Sandaracinaceae bacterium]|nr:acyl-CoA dehydrogenase family protein [Sandaracinaceae bacterium]MBK6810737.1 acyl-CoA dehydrogenase family protein [Sandaracinaceae bacterium]MBK7155119.1 acyl-CoA dehydrogenase family protein [Sandaracinaceae bacterium]MBP7681772.1 acyl-CoA dehydrogenase family protein [Deltaproteobacteria bacterium]